MKPFIRNIVKTALFGAALSFVSTVAVAEHNANLGKAEYMGACAVCHGESGVGNGSFGGMLSTKPTNLTLLAKENGGVFPTDLVYQTIDGRKMGAAHGSRAMPIWGERYKTEAAKHYSDFYGNYDSEAMVRARILSLIDYLNNMQIK
ncbi:MAG: cytochrome c [Rhodospirillaceae bacterium]|nr:cytochrome c [Rhodospirillaceae bacterium]